MKTNVNASKPGFRAALFLSLAALVSSMLVTTTAAPANAAPRDNWTAVNLGGGGDYFDNYDYHTSSRTLGLNGDGWATNVDWAINLFFTGNASISALIYLGPRVGFAAGGGIEHGYVSGTMYQTGGLKQASGCSIPDSMHFRPYAKSNDRSYDMNVGYFVVASAHDDHYEGCGYTDQEPNSKHFISQAFANYGYRVDQDSGAYYFYNYENGYIDGKWWWNTGNPDVIHM
ncbi:MAG: hypothetical protein HOV87_04495 [Catenulispora sp.]|nr:hypothetical protein [Catenulispora sp.]